MQPSRWPATRRSFHSSSSLQKNQKKLAPKGPKSKKERQIPASRPTWKGKYRNYRFSPLSAKQRSDNPLFLPPEERLALESTSDSAASQVPNDAPKVIPSVLSHADRVLLNDIRKSRQVIWDERWTPDLGPHFKPTQAQITVQATEADKHPVTVRYFSMNGMPLTPLDRSKPIAVIKTFGVPRRLLVEFRILPKPFTVIRKVSHDIFEWLSLSSTDSSSPSTSDGNNIEGLPSLVSPLHTSRKIFEITSRSIRDKHSQVASRITFLNSHIHYLRTGEAAPSEPLPFTTTPNNWLESSGLSSLLPSTPHSEEEVSNAVEEVARVESQDMSVPVTPAVGEQDIVPNDFEVDNTEKSPFIEKLEYLETSGIWDRMLPIIPGSESSSSSTDRVLREMNKDEPQPLLESYEQYPGGVSIEDVQAARKPPPPLRVSDHPSPTLEEAQEELEFLNSQVETWDTECQRTQKLLSKLQSSSRAILTGTPGSGKSHLLLQAVEWARKSGWVVIYMPRAQDLVNSTQAYTYDLRTRTYFQPRASYFMLKKILDGNSHLLAKLKLSKQRELWTHSGHRADGAVALHSGHIANINQGLIASVDDQTPQNTQTFPSGSSLQALISFGLDVKEAAPIILDWVLEELTSQTSIPVLIGIDSFQSFFSHNGKTSYRDPRFTRIRSWELSLPRLLLEYASGKRPIQRGAFIGAVSATDSQWPVGTELRDAFLLGGSYGPSIHGPRNVYAPNAPLSENDDGERTGGGLWEKRSSELESYLEGITHIPVPAKMSMEEAQRMYEIWLASGAVLGSHHDEKLLSTYATSGGNPREFVWKGLLSSLDI